MSILEWKTQQCIAAANCAVGGVCLCCTSPEVWAMQACGSRLCLDANWVADPAAESRL